MSCGEVQMYQAYYPYLYQRAAAAGAAAGGSVAPPAAHHRHHPHAPTPASAASGHHHAPFGSPTAASPFAPATAHQYDRFNVQRTLAENPQPSTSSLGLPGELYLHSPAHLTAASSTAAVTSSLHHHAVGSSLLAGGHSATSASTSHSSGGSVSSPGGAGQSGNTTGGISPASSPIRSVSLGQHKVEEDVSLHGRSSTEAGPGGDDDDDDSCQGGMGASSCTSRAQYVSANCVVFTHYSGDAASVVDQHFSRALDKNSPSHGKESSPMSARNFPASFWNSHYQPPVHMGGHPGAELYPTDPYHPAVHATGDPWHTHYQQYTAAAAHHHRAVHDYHHHHGTAAAAMAHQAAAYSGLLLGPPPSARLSHHHMAAAASQCKAGGGPGDWQHHQTSHLDSATAAAYAATYPTMAGLEAQVQESSKDLYWF